MTLKKISAALCALVFGFLLWILIQEAFFSSNISKESRLHYFETKKLDNDDSLILIVAPIGIIAGLYFAFFRDGLSGSTKLFAFGFVLMMAWMAVHFLAILNRVTPDYSLLVHSLLRFLSLAGSSLLFAGSLGWLFQKEPALR